MKITTRSGYQTIEIRRERGSSTDGVTIVSDDRTLVFTAEDFGKAAAELNIEGLTYTPPVKAPTGLGAVVRSMVGTRYVRLGKDNWQIENSGPNNYPYSDREIQAALENGAKIINEGVNP